jgi:hypothetical protein
VKTSVSKLVEDAERRRLRPLRSEDLVAGQVNLPLFDPEPPGLGDFLDRVASVRPLHAHGVGAELVVQGDGLPDLRSPGLIAPVVVEPARETEIADQLLRRNEQFPSAAGRGSPSATERFSANCERFSCRASSSRAEGREATTKENMAVEASISP